jgi:hypothetical protein
LFTCDAVFPKTTSSVGLAEILFQLKQASMKGQQVFCRAKPGGPREFQRG